MAFDQESKEELIKDNLYSLLQDKGYAIVDERDSCYVGLEIIKKDGFVLYNNMECGRSDCNLGDVNEYLNTYTSLNELPECEINNKLGQSYYRSAYLSGSLEHKHGKTMVLKEDFSIDDIKKMQLKGYRITFTKEHAPLNTLVCSKDDQSISLHEYVRCPHKLCSNPCTMIYINSVSSIDDLAKCYPQDELDCFMVEKN